MRRRAKLTARGAAVEPAYTDRATCEVVALIADSGQVASRRGESPAIKAMLGNGLRSLKLDRQLRQTMAATYEAVRRTPENALDHLVKLRAAVLVPVPGLLAEAYLGPERAAELSRRRPPPSATPLCYSAASTGGDR